MAKKIASIEECKRQLYMGILAIFLAAFLVAISFRVKVSDLIGYGGWFVLLYGFFDLIRGGYGLIRLRKERTDPSVASVPESKIEGENTVQPQDPNRP